MVIIHLSFKVTSLRTTRSRKLKAQALVGTVMKLNSLQLAITTIQKTINPFLLVQQAIQLLINITHKTLISKETQHTTPYLHYAVLVLN